MIGRQIKLLRCAAKAATSSSSISLPRVGRNPKQRQSLFNHHKEQAIEGISRTASSSQIRQLYAPDVWRSRLKTLALLDTLVPKDGSADPAVASEAYYAALYSAAFAGEPDRAKLLLAQMRDRGVKPTPEHWAALVEAHKRAGNAEDLIALAEELKADNIELNNPSHKLAITHAHAQLGNLEQTQHWVEELLQGLPSMRTLPTDLSEVAQRAAFVGHSAVTHYIYAALARANASFDSNDFVLAALKLIKLGFVEETKRMGADPVFAKAVNFSDICRVNMLCALYTGNFDALYSLLHEHESRRREPDENARRWLVQGLLDVGELQRAEEAMETLSISYFKQLVILFVRVQLLQGRVEAAKATFFTHFRILMGALDPVLEEIYFHIHRKDAKEATAFLEECLPKMIRTPWVCAATQQLDDGQPIGVGAAIRTKCTHGRYTRHSLALYFRYLTMVGQPEEIELLAGRLDPVTTDELAILDQYIPYAKDPDAIIKHWNRYVDHHGVSPTAFTFRLAIQQLISLGARSLAANFVQAFSRALAEHKMEPTFFALIEMSKIARILDEHLPSELGELVAGPHRRYALLSQSQLQAMQTLLDAMVQKLSQ
jgi:hypothetical protein